MNDHAEGWLANVKQVVFGQDRLLTRLVHLIVQRTGHFDRLHAHGLRSSPFILLHGASGVGKSYLARMLVSYSPYDHQVISCADLFHAGIGESEERLATLLRPHESPFIVVLDDIENLLGEDLKADDTNLVELRMRATLRAAFARLNHSRIPIIVVGTTSRIKSVDAEFLGPPYFEYLLQVEIHSIQQRFETLDGLCRLDWICDERKSDALMSIARRTHSFTVTDLQRLIQEAFYIRLCKPTEPSMMEMSLKYFEDAMLTVRPANMAGYYSPLPDCSLEDLIGLDDEIARLKTMLAQPFENQWITAAYGLKTPRGILLYGPPGSGKTHLALALIKSAGLPYIHVDSSQLWSKYLGQSERNLRDIFDRARLCSPCILFIDQIDALTPLREEPGGTSHRLVTTFLTEMDGIASNSDKYTVVVLATSTNITTLDPAILRPGRLGHHIQIKRLSNANYLGFLQRKMQSMPIRLDDAMCRKIINRLPDNVSGADLDNCCREAALHAIRNNPNASEINFDDFIAIINKSTG